MEKLIPRLLKEQSFNDYLRRIFFRQCVYDRFACHEFRYDGEAFVCLDCSLEIEAYEANPRISDYAINVVIIEDDISIPTFLRLNFFGSQVKIINVLENCKKFEDIESTNSYSMRVEYGELVYELEDNVDEEVTRTSFYCGACQEVFYSATDFIESETVIEELWEHLKEGC